VVKDIVADGAIIEAKNHEYIDNSRTRRELL
jgi:hypothetical protein